MESRNIEITFYEFVDSGETETFIIDGVIFEDWPIYIEQATKETIPCISDGGVGGIVKPTRVPNPPDITGGNSSGDNTPDDEIDDPVREEIYIGPCSDLLSEEVKNKINEMALTLKPCDSNLSPMEYILGNLEESCAEHIANQEEANQDNNGVSTGAGSINEVGDVVIDDDVITQEECEIAFENTELGGFTNVIIGEGAVECELFNCVYEDLQNFGNSLFCSTGQEFIDSDVFHLEYDIVPRYTMNSSDGSLHTKGADAVTKKEGNSVTILIAKDMCNGHPLSMAGTLLHELIHADLYKDALLTDPTLDITNYFDIWNIVFQTGDTPDHELMALEYVETLAMAIQEYDDFQYSNLDYYRYLAWEGLQHAGSQRGIISTLYLSQYLDEYNSIISNNKYDNYCN